MARMVLLLLLTTCTARVLRCAIRQVPSRPCTPLDGELDMPKADSAELEGVQVDEATRWLMVSPAFHNEKN